jgi:hypothetical protein
VDFLIGYVLCSECSQLKLSRVSYLQDSFNDLLIKNLVSRNNEMKTYVFHGIAVMDA